jgi:membrane-associated protease RseP (regulator of RpoE activity)
MHPLAVVYVFGASCSLVHTIAHALAGKALGAEVEEISLFGGPTIARIRLGGTLWVVNLVPGLGTHVKFRVKGSDELSKGFNDLHPLHRILVIATGSLALVAVALACLGPMGGTRSIWHGFREVVRGGLAPVVTGAPLVRSLLQLIRVSPSSTSLGIVAAKMAAFNLLPLLPLDGGQILWNLAQWRARFSDRIAIGVTYVGLLAILILSCGWLYAIARVLIHG